MKYHYWFFYDNGHAGLNNRFLIFSVFDEMHDQQIGTGKFSLRNI